MPRCTLQNPFSAAVRPRQAGLLTIRNYGPGDPQGAGGGQIFKSAVQRAARGGPLGVRVTWCEVGGLFAGKG